MVNFIGYFVVGVALLAVVMACGLFLYVTYLCGRKLVKGY